MADQNDQSKFAASTSTALTVKFSGRGRDVRLIQVLFESPLGTVRSQTGRTARNGEGTFGWTNAVQALSLLAVRSARSTMGGDAPTPDLIGGQDSAANSLDLAISKGVASRWLTEMFGIFSDDRPVAKRLFERRNSNRKIKGQPVTVFFNSRFLPYENIVVVRDDLPVQEADELDALMADLSAALDSSEVEEETVPGVPSVLAERRQTFHERYREIWTSDDGVSTKISRSEELLGNTLAKPFIILLYSIRIFAEENGDARFEFEVVIVNCGTQPMIGHSHEFRFDDAQSIPFEVIARGEDRVQAIRDESHYKCFFIKFSKPLAPSDVWHYRFEFSCRSIFKNDSKPKYWDIFFPNTVTNQLMFQLTHKAARRPSPPIVERVSQSGAESIMSPRPLAVEWDRGITIHWQLPFPEVGSTYRVQWNRFGAIEASPNSAILR
jgi:hypothetical protein